MALQLYAYIEHKNGVADDTALELVSAAKKIDASANPIAIVCGSGADLDAVCKDAAASYAEVWKIDNDAFAYPNAEVIRKLLVNLIEIVDEKKIRVGREIEGGNQEINEIELPCVLSIQTGINEPRYVGIRGIRKVASVDIPVQGLADLGMPPDSVGTAGARVKRADYFVPDPGEGAEMLEGSTDEIIDKLIELLKSKGGIK